MPTFATLIERNNSFDEQKHDTYADSRKSWFDEVGNFNFFAPGDNSALSLPLESLPISQLAGRLGPQFWKTSKRVIPAEVYRQMYREFPGVFAKLTNRLLDDNDGKLLVRGYGDKVRAILSDQYARFDNADVLDTASKVLGGLPTLEIVESGKYYSHNDGVQRDGLTVRAVVKNVLPPGEQGPYGLGVLIRNDETGGGATEIRPLVMRSVCLNSLIFRSSEDGVGLGLRLTHRGHKQAKINLLAAAIEQALPMAAEGLDRFLSTKTVEIDLGKAIERLGEEYGWSEEARLNIGVGSEGHQSVYGLVNGITRAANQLELDQSARFDLEALASVFVYQPHIAVNAARRRN